MPLSSVLRSPLRSALRTAIGDGVGGLRPSSANVAFFGDSRTNQNLFSSSRYGQRSYPYWLRLYSGQRLDTTAALNFGVSSDTTAQMAARVDTAVTSMVSAGVGTVVFLGGTNDVVNIATSSADIDYCINAFRTAGIVVLLVTETPRDTENALHLAIRDYCRTLNNPSGGIYTVDIWPTLANGDAGALAGVTVDGIHLTVYANRILGQALAIKLNSLLAARNVLPTISEDVTLIGSNLFANALLSGTGGSKTTVTGEVADSWSASNSTTGCTVVASKVTRDGYTWQRLDISGTPTAASPFVRFEQNQDAKVAGMLALNGLKLGDTVDAGFALRVDAGSAGCRGVKVTFVLGDSPIDGQEDTGASTAGYLLDAGGFEGVSRIVPRTISSDATNCRLRIEAVGLQSTPFTLGLEIGRPFGMSVT